MFETAIAEELLARVGEAVAARDAASTAVALAVADALTAGAFATGSGAQAHPWLRAYTGSDRDDTRRILRLARLLARHAATRVAVEKGRLPIARAAVLATAVTDDRRSAYIDDEAVLLEQLATLERIDHAELVVAAWCAIVDQDRHPACPNAAPTPSATSPVTPPTPWRTRRRPHRNAPMCRPAAITRRRPTPADGTTPLRTIRASTPTTIDRPAERCEPNDGAVIDATERRADFTDTQRRLIAARDRHCTFPACRVPASWCDIHHLHHRASGGGRTLENGVLLCRRHHTLLHVGPPGHRWHLHRDPHGPGWHATSPTGTTPGAAVANDHRAHRQPAPA